MPPVTNESAGLIEEPGRPRADSASELMQIVQVYYRADQLATCTYKTFFNPPPATADEAHLFFESRVLVDWIGRRQHGNAEYLGVVSYQVEQKLARSKRWLLPLRNISRISYSRERFAQFVAENEGAPVIALARFVPHSVFAFAELLHPGICHATETVLRKIGIREDVRGVYRYPIYFNFFVARLEIMEDYVTRLLKPFIEAACADHDLRGLLRQNSRYPYPWPDELKRLFGLPYHPLHPFIGERLINVYLEMTGTPVIYFDSDQSLRWPFNWYPPLEPSYHRLAALLMPLKRKIQGGVTP